MLRRRQGRSISRSHQLNFFRSRQEDLDAAAWASLKSLGLKRLDLDYLTTSRDLLLDLPEGLDELVLRWPFANLSSRAVPAVRRALESPRQPQEDLAGAGSVVRRHPRRGRVRTVEWLGQGVRPAALPGLRRGRRIGVPFRDNGDGGRGAGWVHGAHFPGRAAALAVSCWGRRTKE
ncbi:hypothetical protein DFJ74DRAFT_239172 [Hyaloraphidium curvatum]|nr:hypothetical protein DFJ74DRAFT_239172 [Hyaloraphidium curvatum]